ncbi:MAG: hypothetical protein OEZ06_03965 [Myxococcales bacterium]|nr:hypothetical protein [Myxococcales bacterium]
MSGPSQSKESGSYPLAGTEAEEELELSELEQISDVVAVGGGAPAAAAKVAVPGTRSTPPPVPPDSRSGAFRIPSRPPPVPHQASAKAAPAPAIKAPPPALQPTPPPALQPTPPAALQPTPPPALQRSPQPADLRRELANKSTQVREQGAQIDRLRLGMRMRDDTIRTLRAELERERERVQALERQLAAFESAKRPDDLQRIKGIGPGFAKLLKANGIESFAQLAELDESGVAKIAAVLNIPVARIETARWVEQARELSS